MIPKANDSRKAKIKYYLRRVVQTSSILLFFYLLQRTRYPLPEKFPLNIYFRTDTLLGISSTLTSRHFSYLFFPGLVMLALVAILGNFFCFWICPLGGLVDTGNSLLFRKRWKLNPRIPSWLRKIRFFILGGILSLSLLGYFCKIPYLVWIFDPLVILTRAIVVKKEWLALFVLLLLASFLIPRLWCNNFCPLGALYYLFGTKIRSSIRRKKGEDKPPGIS